jgi:gluconate kinase
VLACSALKQSYRERLGVGVELRICKVKGTYREMAARLQSRTGHFAGEGTLAGQFAGLEAPRDASVEPVSETPEDIVGDALRKLQLG